MASRARGLEYVGRPPVLILGSGITALGCLRALGRLRTSAWVVDAAPNLARHSRWFHAAPGRSGDTLPSYLESLPEGRWVLLPCSDDWVRAVAGLGGTLQARFPSTRVAPEVVETFLDKRRFGDFLDAHGLPHPRTYHPGDPEAARMPQLLFIKPRDSQRFFQAFGRKAFWPDSDADLEKKLELAAREGADVVLQEYVPGPPANHVFVDGFVDSSGRTKARFARRRLRMFPRRFGNSSYMVSVPLTEVTDAVEVVDAILQESDYRGIFSAELKKDENDGAFKVLEVNIRPWWFVEFAATCGVNVAAMAYHDALGNHVGEVSTYRVGRRMSHPYYDWFACRSESSGLPGALLKWCGSLAGARQPVFSWDDPMPALAEFGALARSFVRRRLERVLHR